MNDLSRVYWMDLLIQFINQFISQRDHYYHPYIIMNYILKIPSNFRGTYPVAGKLFIAGSLLGLVFSGYSWIQAGSAQKELEWRKTQLALPVYRLSEQEHINPPWNADNINEWLYRRVEVGGRPLHRLTCLIPNSLRGIDGFQYVVPLLVREAADRSNPQGLILSKGFIPFIAKDVGQRYRIEDATYQKFTGFVSKLPEFANTSFLSGNSTNDDKLGFTCSDTEDFVAASGFTNKKQASVALVEQLHELGVLDERRSERRAVDCAGTANYPYAKTEAGALQLPKMPWDYKNDSRNYLVASIFSFIVGASIF